MGYSNEDSHQQAPYKKNEFENKKKFSPRQILQSEDRCHKCGDSKHIEGFQGSACKYQCRHCHKFGNFYSLCYKKKESYKKRPRSPKAYQLTSGRLSANDNSICSHSSDTHQVMNFSAWKWRYKLYKLIQMFQHPNICLPIWNSKSTCTRTKPSSCEPKLIPAQM